MAKNKKISLVISAKNQAKGVFNQVKKGLSGIGSLAGKIFSPTGILFAGLSGLGIGKLAGSFLDAAKQTENYKIRLQGLLGSQAEGNRLFKEMAEYASRVPFEYQQIMASATQLSGILSGGVDEIKEWIPLIGDLAAASGLDIQTATEQVSRMLSAGAASADLFRERGVLAMLGFKAGVSYSADETRKKLMEAWTGPESRFRGATTAMAGTWDGMVSMLKDAWFSFRTAVMDSGPFQAIKGYLKGVIDQVNEFKKSGKFEEIATKIGGGITTALDKFVNALPAIFNFMLSVVEKIIMAVGGWRDIIAGLKWVIAEVRLWSYNFIQDLRGMVLWMAQMLHRIPGVDTSAQQADIGRQINASASENSWKLNAAAEEAKQAFFQTVDSAQKFDKQVEKTFDNLSAGFETAIKNITQLVEGQKEAGQAAEEGSKKAVVAIDDEAAAIARLIDKYHQLNLAKGRKGGSFNIAKLSDSIEDAERTE
jgi:hypothetical protein